MHPGDRHDFSVPEHDDERLLARKHIVEGRVAFPLHAPSHAQEAKHEPAQHADGRHTKAPTEWRVVRRAAHVTSESTISATRCAAPGAPNFSRTAVRSSNIRRRSALS